MTELYEFACVIGKPFITCGVWSALTVFIQFEFLKLPLGI